MDRTSQPRTSTMHIGPWSIVFEQDMIPVRSNLPRADERWTFIDDAGHGHFYGKGYPTLFWVSQPCSMGHGSDCTSEGYWECPHCHEEITPGTLPPLDVEYIAGPRSARVEYANGREQRTYVVDSAAEYDLLKSDPVAGIQLVQQREPVNRTWVSGRAWT